MYIHHHRCCSCSSCPSFLLIPNCIPHSHTVQLGLMRRLQGPNTKLIALIIHNDQFSIILPSLHLNTIIQYSKEKNSMQSLTCATTSYVHNYVMNLVIFLIIESYSLTDMTVNYCHATTTNLNQIHCHVNPIFG